jgi:hypothetical protein
MPSNLSLRDYFAALAMQGLLAADIEDWSSTDIAEVAYKQADEMLKMRAQNAQ